MTAEHLSFEDVEDSVLDGDRVLAPSTAASALRHRTFRIVFFGAFLSNIGSWMQNVVLGAYAYDISHSPTFVGVLVFAQLGPSLLLAMVGGVIADAVDRKALLIWISVEQLVFSFALAFVTRSADPSKSMIFFMVLAVGIGQAIYAPTYSALIPALVGKRDLGGAISLNSAQMNGSRVIGPVIGAVLYHLVGPSWVFAGNAVTYVFVIIAMCAVKIPPPEPVHDPDSKGWRQLTVGLKVAREDVIVARCLVTVFVFSLLALVWVGQFPVVAGENLGIDPKSVSYGILYACFGTGALSGALAIGTFLAGVPKHRIVRVSLFSYAATLAVFALLSSPTAAYAVVFVLGAFYFAMITALSTTLQLRLDDAVRGRVMALWIMGFGGTVSLGNLFYGPIIDRFGVTAVLLSGSVVAVALGFYADVSPRAAAGAPLSTPLPLGRRQPRSAP